MGMGINDNKPVITGGVCADCLQGCCIFHCELCHDTPASWQPGKTTGPGLCSTCFELKAHVLNNPALALEVIVKHSKLELCVLAVGTPFDGVRLYGPLPDVDQAGFLAEDHHSGDDWWTVKLDATNCFPLSWK